MTEETHNTQEPEQKKPEVHWVDLLSDKEVNRLDLAGALEKRLQELTGQIWRVLTGGKASDDDRGHPKKPSRHSGNKAA